MAPTAKKVGWMTMSFVLMSDQIGYGILSLPKAYANLGYIGGSCTVLLLGALTTYTGLLLAKIKHSNPHMKSYRQLFAETFSPTVGLYAALCVKYVPIHLLFLIAPQTHTNDHNIQKRNNENHRQRKKNYIQKYHTHTCTNRIYIYIYI
jgi:Transmembrane amino acid transporter protein